MLVAHKTMPAAMAAICEGQAQIDGFICPGHVSAITGAQLFDFLASRYKKSCAISGFEPLDLVESILMLIRQQNTRQSQVDIQYKRAVSQSGNKKAQSIMNEVFEPAVDYWRGFGKIEDSGLALRKEYEEFDAGKRFKIPTQIVPEPSGCACGEILTGIKQPLDCSLFAKQCTPTNPIGACMVSNEGACHAYYKFKPTKN